MNVTEMYSEPCEIPKMEIFAKVINGWEIIFVKKVPS